LLAGAADMLREDRGTLLDALKGLLDCPALNLDELEPGDIEAIDRATAAIAKGN